MRIEGDNFLPGASVTVGGAATDLEVFNRAILFATTLPHVAAQVDVVVTNPDGQSGTLRGGYTYALGTKGPPPTISSIVPAVGIVAGGTSVVVAGNGFREGATVTFGGELMRANLHYGNQEFFLQTRARGHGTVDVVVTNPDSESTTVSRGFTFVAPESLDLDGRWEGSAGDHWEIPFQFTIENRTLTVASCGGAAATRFSPPPSTARGEFTLVQRGVGSISGKFSSDSYGTGNVDIPGCERTQWEMWKK